MHRNLCSCRTLCSEEILPSDSHKIFLDRSWFVDSDNSMKVPIFSQVSLLQ